MTVSAVRRVLLVDDDDAFDNDLSELLAEANYEVFRARDRQTAQLILTEKRVPLVLLGMNQSQEDSLGELRWLKTHFPHVEVVIFSGRGHFRAAFDAMSLGAYDFLIKSPDMGEFLPVIDHAFDHAWTHSRKKSPDGSGGPRPDPNLTGIIGRSLEMQAVRDLIAKAAPSDAPALISGETGVGKELAARMLHRCSRRSAGPFVPINCAAIPEALLENELFGHAKGAYTDSGQMKPGLLEEADTGTLFLDEVSELCPALQAKLLRVLDAGTFRRLGDNKERHVDVRIVAAANRDFAEEMKAGRFRVDFYYRLAVILIDIPPLRRRQEDIPMLVDHFFKLHASAQKGLGKKISNSAMRLLMEYSWPGNVREMRNIVERLAILTDNKVITPADIVHIVRLPAGGQHTPPSQPTPIPNTPHPLNSVI